jgi:hypothetical protein
MHLDSFFTVFFIIPSIISYYSFMISLFYFLYDYDYEDAQQYKVKFTRTFSAMCTSSALSELATNVVSFRGVTHSSLVSSYIQISRVAYCSHFVYITALNMLLKCVENLNSV